jgi:hypothetical protein
MTTWKPPIGVGTGVGMARGRKTCRRTPVCGEGGNFRNFRFDLDYTDLKRGKSASHRKG